MPQHEALEQDNQARAVDLHARAIQLLFMLEDDEEQLTLLLRRMTLLRLGLVPMWCNN